MLPSTQDMMARFERITTGKASPAPASRGMAAATAAAAPGVLLTKRARAGHEIAAQRVREKSAEEEQQKRKRHQQQVLENGMLKEERERLQLRLTNSIAEGRVMQRKLKIMEQMMFGVIN